MFWTNQFWQSWRFFQIEQDHDKSFRKHDIEDHGNMTTYNVTTLILGLWSNFKISIKTNLLWTIMWVWTNVYCIQKSKQVISSSPPINMNYWIMYNEDGLNTTTWANHCDWPMKTNCITISTLLESTISYVCLD